MTLLPETLVRLEKSAKELLSQVEAKVTERTAEAISQAKFMINEEAKKSRTTAARLIEDVARENRSINASKWFAVTGSVCTVIGCLSFGGGYWVARTASDSEAVRSGKFLVGDEGRAAVRLAEIGQAKTLLECSGTGWTRKDGICYGTEKDGKITGWRTK